MESKGFGIDPITEAVKRTKETIAGGADWIKVFASTGSFDDVTGDHVCYVPTIDHNQYYVEVENDEVYDIVAVDGDPLSDINVVTTSVGS